MRLHITGAMFAACIQESAGWDRSVHMLIARLSLVVFEDDPSALAYLSAHLMQTIREDPDQSGTQAQKVSTALAQVSAWADTQSETAHLHYVYSPEGACGDFVERHVCGSPDRPECILTGIRYYLEIASDPAASSSARTEAIKYILHLAADGNAPLHAGFERDAGGNRIHLKDPLVSLHQLWDGRLFYSFLGYTYSDDDHQALSIRDLAHGMMAQARAGIKAFRFSNAKLDSREFIMDMLAETSRELTCDKAYFSDGLGRVIKSGDNLLRDDPDYFQSRGELAVQQVVKSAVRVGQVLQYVAQNFRARKAAMLAEREIVNRPTRIAAAQAPLAPAPGVPVRNRYLSLAEELDPTNDETQIQLPVEFESAGEGKADGTSTDKLHVRLPKSFIQGINIDSLALIRRSRLVVIVTSRDRANRYLEAIPRSAQTVEVQFGLEGDTKQFIFDSDAIPESTRLDAQFVTCVLKRFKGIRLTELDQAALTDLDPTSYVAQVPEKEDWAKRLVMGATALGIAVTRKEAVVTEPLNHDPSIPTEADHAELIARSLSDPLIVLHSPGGSSTLVTRVSMICRPFPDNLVTINAFGAYSFDGEKSVPGMLFVDQAVWNFEASQGFHDHIFDAAEHQGEIRDIRQRAVHDPNCRLPQILRQLDEAIHNKAPNGGRLGVISGIVLMDLPNSPRMDPLVIKLRPLLRSSETTASSDEWNLRRHADNIIRLKLGHHTSLVTRVEYLADSSRNEIGLVLKDSAGRPVLIDERLMGRRIPPKDMQFVEELGASRENAQRAQFATMNKPTKYLQAVNEAISRINRKSVKFEALARDIEQSPQPDGSKLIMLTLKS